MLAGRLTAEPRAGAGRETHSESVALAQARGVPFPGRAGGHGPLRTDGGWAVGGSEGTGNGQSRWRSLASMRGQIMTGASCPSRDLGASLSRACPLAGWGRVVQTEAGSAPGSLWEGRPASQEAYAPRRVFSTEAGRRGVARGLDAATDRVTRALPQSTNSSDRTSFRAISPPRTTSRVNTARSEPCLNACVCSCPGSYAPRGVFKRPGNGQRGRKRTHRGPSATTASR